MYYFCVEAEDKLKAEEEIPDADEENTIADCGEDVNYDDEDMDFDQVINGIRKFRGLCQSKESKGCSKYENKASVKNFSVHFNSD